MILERLHSVKNNSQFEIAALFHPLYGEGKSASISKLESNFTEWKRSYFVFALTKVHRKFNFLMKGNAYGKFFKTSRFPSNESEKNDIRKKMLMSKFFFKN